MATQKKARAAKRNVVKVAPTPQTPQRQPGKLYPIVAAISLLGLADATFLFVEYLAGRTDVCSAGSYLNCGAVLGSEYAKIGDIPLSLFGAVAYFLVFSLAILATYGYRKAEKWIAVLVAVMFVTTVYLLYLQAFVILHYCPYCLFSAGITVVLTCLIWIPKLMKRSF